MDLAGEFAPERDLVVVIDHRIVRQDAPARMNGDEGGDDGADPAAGEFQLPVDASLVAGAVVVVEAAGHVGAEDAVFDRERAELKWFKENVGHGGLLAGWDVRMS